MECSSLKMFYSSSEDWRCGEDCSEEKPSWARYTSDHRTRPCMKLADSTWTTNKFYIPKRTFSLAYLCGTTSSTFLLLDSPVKNRKPKISSSITQVYITDLHILPMIINNLENIKHGSVLTLPAFTISGCPTSMFWSFNNCSKLSCKRKEINKRV